MDYSLFFNHLSLPAGRVDEAYTLLLDAFLAVLELYQDDDRFQLFSEGKNLDIRELAHGFTFRDFKNTLSDKNEIDLLMFIMEIEDKSPFIDHISGMYIDELFTCIPYLREYPSNESMDIFNLAWLESGIMLSLATHKRWQNYVIEFWVQIQGKVKDEKRDVYNISTREHAKLVLQALEPSIRDVCPDVFFTERFMDWFNECKSEDKNKIKTKLRHCYEHNFLSGRPIIDTLKGSEFPNMKEIRVGNEHAGSGKIRILFAQDSNRRVCILVGFIKHSNDYRDYIDIADSLFYDRQSNISDQST